MSFSIMDVLNSTVVEDTFFAIPKPKGAVSRDYYLHAYQWDVGLWSGMMNESLTQLNFACQKKEAEEDILGAAVFSIDDGYDDDMSDIGGEGHLDEVHKKLPKIQNLRGNSAFEASLVTINHLKSMLKAMPTNFDDVDVPRSPAQLIAQELLLSTMIPAILGQLYKSVSYLLADYFVIDFDIPLQVVILSRRSGKSTLISMLLVVILWVCSNFPILVMAKFVDQANIILETVKEIALFCFGNSNRWSFSERQVKCRHPGKPPSKIQSKASNVKVQAKGGEEEEKGRPRKATT